MSAETRSISLNSYDINTSKLSSSYTISDVTTSAGTIGQFFNFMTWQDINLRTLLGDSYFNQYNTFSIKLVQCLVAGLTNVDDSHLTGQTDSPIEFVLEGLQFKNYNSTPYSITNINSVNSVSIYTGKLSKLQSFIDLQTTSPCTKINVENSQPYIFKKPATDTVTLTVRKYNPSTQQYLNKIGYGHFNFIFEVTGV